MTEEQIKQNAEEYANTHKYTLDELNNSILTVDEIVRLAYIAGAHSRDEEVNQLENALRNVNEYCHQLRNKVYELRNPWISVEDRLPEKTRNLSPFPDEYNEMVVLVINKQSGKRLAYRDYKGVWRDDYTCEIVNQNYAKITHWMPIPELTKGE